MVGISATAKKSTTIITSRSYVHHGSLAKDLRACWSQQLCWHRHGQTQLDQAANWHRVDWLRAPTHTRTHRRRTDRGQPCLVRSCALRPVSQINTTRKLTHSLIMTVSDILGSVDTVDTEKTMAYTLASKTWPTFSTMAFYLWVMSNIQGSQNSVISQYVNSSVKKFIF